MIFPNVINGSICDKNLNVTPAWMQYFTQTTTELQNNFSDEGIVLPSQNTATINQLTGPSPAMIYDSQTSELKVKLNGVWRVVQVI